MANNIPAFRIELRADLITLLTNTANLDSATKIKIRNAFVSEFPIEWVESGLPDTPANRSVFVADRVFVFMQGVFESASLRSNLATLPPTEKLI